MQNKKKVTFLILALAWPLLYQGLNKLWYFMLFDMDVINKLPETLRVHLLTNPFSLDAIFCVIMILITVPLFLKIRKSDKANIQPTLVKKMSFKGFLASIVIAFGLAGVSAIYQLIIRKFFMNVGTVAESVKSFDQTFQSTPGMASYFWSLLSIAILGPIVEELIFRGVLFSGINKYLSGGVTVLITAVYFGLWHGNPMQMVYTALLGIGVGLAYAATRNMWFPVTIHLANNILSQPPPALENSEAFILTSMALRFIAIIPMIIILVKWCRKNPALSWKNTGSV